MTWFLQELVPNKTELYILKLPQAYKGHAGDEATPRCLQTVSRQGELWWNTTNSTLEVYTGSQWKSATGLQEITVTEAFAQELNALQSHIKLIYYYSNII